MEECGNIHRCVTVLTAGGRIVKQDWENIDYVLYVNPLSEITDEKPSAYEKISLAKRWEDDMQLFSQYLDAKVEQLPPLHLFTKMFPFRTPTQ